MTTCNEEAYPCKHVYPDGDVSYRKGLTKLELISAMCLQGMLGNKEFFESHPASLASYSIIFAKELLKQLEAENDN